jgi:hypothetical protein
MVRRTARQVTDRDRAVLHWIGQAGIASLEQVARFAWADQRRRTAQERLRRLVRLGYLQQAFGAARPQDGLVYSLTRQGWLLFPPEERDQLQIGWPPPRIQAQQLLSQEAYLHLALEAQAGGSTLISWRTERELRRELQSVGQTAVSPGAPPPADEVPDGQAVIADADGAITTLDIEIDGQYYGRMLRQKVAQYGQSGRPTVWVCIANRAGTVQRATQMYPNIRVLVV